MPALASYGWDNDINVGIDGMSWTYTEQYSANNSILFKSFIDSDLGDNDNFVSAWELLKADKYGRKQLSGILKANMDVKVNGSSASIKPVRVESDLSAESLGPVKGAENIVNIYEVYYAFADPMPSKGDISFLGQPATDVTITLPESISVISTEGIDNVLITSDGSLTQISGKFGLTGEAVVYFERSEILFIEAEGPNEVQAPALSNERSFHSVIDDVFPGFTEDLLRELKGSSPL